MPSPSLPSALVRILIDDQNPRRPVGAGFLVTPEHIITCAHVINDALGHTLNAADLPDAEILLDFPLLSNPPLLRARILHWFPVREDSAVGEREDIAVLKLLPDIPLPVEARPAPVVLPNEGSFHGQRVRMCGFPIGVDHGTYTNGILQDLTAKGWIEIHHQDSGAVEQGFSGTAVWSVQENAVCGMMVSRMNKRNAAYMIPAALLIKALPAMEQLSRPLNPYQGLKAFRKQDARFYFGRKKTVDRLAEAVAEQPFVAVIGASGSGKSSLVFAGLTPVLEATGDWLIAHCRPKQQPFYELAACLVPLLYDDELERIKKIKQCAVDLLSGELSLSDLLRSIIRTKEAGRFLLIVDQFEELYTLNPDSALVRRYIKGLLEAGRIEGCTVLITMRADFFGRAIDYDLLAETLNEYAPINLSQINEQGLRQAIARPAEILNVKFEPGLIDLIIRDLGDEPGSLPLLEFCLTQLWEKQSYRQISHDAYTAIGGVQQALANHADAVYAEFDEEDRKRLRHIFLKLVRPGQGTEDTRQVATIEQIQAAYRELITRLADKRLVVTGRDEENGQETVEVVHEALIRRWQALRQWVDEERDFLVWQDKLRVPLGQWLESGRDAGALLHDLPLDEALNWQATHAGYLAEEELGFVETSEQLRDQERKTKEKLRRRNITGLAVGLVIAVLLSAITGWQWLKVTKEKDRAEQQTLTANYNLAKAFEEKALTALKTAKNKEAMLFASAVLAQQIPKDRAALQASSIKTLFVPQVFKAALAELTVLKGHAKSVTSAAFSPDGKSIVSASRDKTLRIWDADTGQQLAILKGHEQGVSSAAFSPDGKKIVSASRDKTLRIWDADTGQQLAHLKGHADTVTSAAFSPDSKSIISASEDGTLRIWDAATGQQMALFKEHQGWITSATFSPDGKSIISASWDKTVRIWDADTGQQLAILKGHDQGVSSAAFSPDGKSIVSASWDKTVRIWDADTGQQLALLKGHADQITSATFSPDGKSIVSTSGIFLGTGDNTVRIWNAKTGHQRALLKGHTARVTSAAFSPDGKSIVFASWDKTVRIWYAATGQQMVRLKGHKSWVNSAAFSPDGKSIISASRGGTLRIWDAATGEQMALLKGHQGWVNSAAFSPDGKSIVSASDDGTLRVWDAATGEKMALLKEHTKGVISAAFSPDGKSIISASRDKTVRIWDTVTGQQLALLKGHASSVTSATFSPDGKSIASSSYDKTLRIWDAATGQQRAVLKGHAARVTSANFSPDGESIVSASRDKTLRIWDAKTGQQLALLKGHTEWVISAAFSPDGKSIVSASWDKTLRIWDAKTGELLVLLKGHAARVTSANFSPDGESIVSAFDDGTLKIWDLQFYNQFLHNYKKPTPLYYTFIEAIKFLWQLDVYELRIVRTERRTQADLEQFGTLLAPPPPGQSKFDQVLHWAEEQQGKPKKK